MLGGESCASAVQCSDAYRRRGYFKPMLGKAGVECRGEAWGRKTVQYQKR